MKTKIASLPPGAKVAINGDGDSIPCQSYGILRRNYKKLGLSLVITVGR
jgi:hypothetical protein